MRERPDWVCEGLSPGNAGRDRTVKMELYRAHGVAHVWLADVNARVVEAFRLEGAFYVPLGAWEADEAARIAPFDEAPLDRAGIFGVLGPRA